jgi:hypothetical protein
VVLGGTLIPVGRVAADRPFYLDKNKEHGMNPQVIASPRGELLRVSGSVHNKKAVWIWGIGDEMADAGLVTLANKCYQGAVRAKVPYRGRNKPES